MTIFLTFLKFCTRNYKAHFKALFSRRIFLIDVLKICFQNQGRPSREFCGKDWAPYNAQCNSSWLTWWNNGRIVLNDIKLKWLNPCCGWLLKNQRPELTKNAETATGVFYKKVVFKNFAKLKEKIFCRSLFLNKFSVIQPATLLKKKLQHRCFLVNFAKCLKNTIFTEHPQWLFLSNGRSRNLTKLTEMS